MLLKKSMFIILAISAMIGLVDCSLHPTIKPEETFVRIKPLAPLSELDNESMPDNLIISIDNVADMNNSYKNRLELFVNKYQIEPDEVYNYKSAYRYNLKLQPGQYKIYAKYYAHSGWVEQSFTIITREIVKVYMNKKTTLQITLEKNHWGGLNDKVSYFKISQESLETN